MATLDLTLNGVPLRVEVRQGETLLETLRTRCGVMSIKDGCQPQGQCGCCLVLIDGNAKVSCAMPAEAARGRSIVTLEGVAAEEQRMLARSFVVAAGVQCGFCIPGIALRAHHLVARNAAPSRAEIARAIDGHLCRCTGYAKIIDAIEIFARARRGEVLPDLMEGGVGVRAARFRGAELILGRKEFVDDLVRPGMLHGAVVLSPHARARVVSIDTRKARAHPGVVAVATADDVPGQRHYGLLRDDWPGFVAAGEEVSYVGDIVAAIAAVDEATAREAATLVDVEYELLAPILDPENAERIFSRTHIKRGDVDAALAASAHVVRGTWRTQRIEHLFLEPESAMAEPLEGGRLRLFSSGQGIFDDRRQVAAFLGIPEEDLLVEQLSSGGAFGGKEDLSIQAHAALLTFMTKRPVKLTLNREESIRIHPKRHPMTLDYTAGCDAEGHLTAVHARILGDSGAYASVGDKVLERAAGHACGAYHVPNADIEATAAYTNNPPCGAMRGFGVNQTNFAMEGCIDLLAKEAGIDPWEMRWRNALDVGGMFTTGQVLEKSVGLKKTLVAVRPQYEEAKRRGRAVGIACGVKNSGIGNGVKELGRARLVVEHGGTISIYFGFSEMGQGLSTILVQFAVEVTKLSASCFVPRVDTRFALDCGQTTGSRATLLAGRAVVEAAKKLRLDLDRGATPESLAGREYAGEVVIDDTNALGTGPKTHTTFGFATQLCILDEQGRVERIVAAHDVGRAINPAFCEGQIEGAVHMGLGYALTEELPCPGGMPATFKLMEIGVLRATDMPPVDVILVEDPEPEGPFGAKGVGEIGLVPTAPAVAGALEAFDGIRRMTLPMKDSAASRVMRAGHLR
ncbi:MAG TPA: selenium-dependent xanthine dehydrogenase [Thermoanaerobaculia bacterium]